MTAQEKLLLAATANCVSRHCRTSAPTLWFDSEPSAVVAWLQWNDPNGIHEWRPNATEEELEARPYYTEESEVWDALSEMLESCV